MRAWLQAMRPRAHPWCGELLLLGELGRDVEGRWRRLLGQAAEADASLVV
jgi:hypothetical protein